MLKNQHQQLINEKLKNKVYKKNAERQNVKKTNPYSNSKRSTCSKKNQVSIENQRTKEEGPNNNKYEQVNQNESNIYESVPDASIINPNKEMCSQNIYLGQGNTKPPYYELIIGKH